MARADLDRRGEARAVLPHHVNARRQPRRDLRYIVGRAHDRRMNARQRLNERQCIAQHAVGQLDHVARRVHSGQPGLHQSLAGSLRHDHDGTAHLVRPGSDQTRAHVTGPGSAGLVRARSRVGSDRISERLIGERVSNIHCAAYSPARPVTSS